MTTQPNNATPAQHTPTPATFCPTLPFKASPIEAFGPGAWKSDIRDALNIKLCAVIERDFTPKENVRQKAAFIVRACNSFAEREELLRRALCYLDSQSQLVADIRATLKE